MVTDTARGRVLLYGGEIVYDSDYGQPPIGPYPQLSDVWEWNGTAWSATPVHDGVPSVRTREAYAFDTARGELVLIGAVCQDRPVAGVDQGLRDECRPRNMVALASRLEDQDRAHREASAIFLNASASATYSSQWL